MPAARSDAFCGRYESSSRTRKIDSASSSATNWQTPLRSWTLCPPSSAELTCSPSTSATTPGPVRNMLALLGHHHEVRERGRVGAAACGGAGDHRDLGHLPGQLHVLAEDAPVAAERRGALLHARAAGLHEADHRHARRARQLEHPHDRVRMRLAQRAAGEPGVLRVAEDRPPIDLPRAGHHAVARARLLPHAAGADGRADRAQRADVAEQLEPVVRGHGGMGGPARPPARGSAWRRRRGVSA